MVLLYIRILFLLCSLVALVVLCFVRFSRTLLICGQSWQSNSLAFFSATIHMLCAEQFVVVHNDCIATRTKGFLRCHGLVYCIPSKEVLNIIFLLLSFFCRARACCCVRFRWKNTEVEISRHFILVQFAIEFRWNYLKKRNQCCGSRYDSSESPESPLTVHRSHRQRDKKTKRRENELSEVCLCVGLASLLKRWSF